MIINCRISIHNEALPTIIESGMKDTVIIEIQEVNYYHVII